MADPKAAANPTTLSPIQQEERYRSQVTGAAVTEPFPPSVYRGLKVGQHLSLEYEDNEARPIDGSNSKFNQLRETSPFVIQVEVPLVFGSSHITSKQTDAKGLYQAALSQRYGYSRARRSLASSSFIQGNLGTAGTIEETVALGDSKSSGGTIHRVGTTKIDSAGGNTTQGKLGEPAIADLKVATDIAFQLRAILSTPPLVLLINPQSLGMTYTKIQQFSDRTRQGYVFQAWGEDQPRLQIEAKCGAFISGKRGVQYASKRDSAAWQNLMTAFQFYKNNGYLYDTIGKSYANHFVGALSIRYDQWIYYGHMESLSFTYDEANVHGGVSFSMGFVVSSMMDTAPPVLQFQDLKTIPGEPGIPPNENPVPLDVPPVGGGQALPAGAVGTVPAVGMSVDPQATLTEEPQVTGVGGFRTSMSRSNKAWRSPEEIELGQPEVVLKLVRPEIVRKGAETPFNGGGR